jgi:hypothetical protein
MKTLIAASTLLLSAISFGASDTEYAELVSAFATETAQYRDAGAKVPALLPDVSPSHAQFLAAAERHAGTEAALPFLGWLLQNAPRNAEAHGAAVAAIDVMARELPKQNPAQQKESYKQSGTAVRLLKYETVGDAVFARTLLNAKALAHSATDESVRTSSAQSVFKLERLQVGMVAPDIVAPDLDGVEFSLSDYRGKVVVIDFWGDW